MSNIKIGRTVVGSVGTNCYFVFRDDAKKALVFDPGDSGKKIYDRLKENGIEVSAILLTHGHFDHILGVKELKEAAGCKVYSPEAEQRLLEDPELNCSGMIGRVGSVKTDEWLRDNEEIELEGIKIKVLSTPGHTEGSACFYIEEAGILIAGDTLFEGSVGRTDLPTGNMGDLVHSIRSKLMTLPEDTLVYPGHGDETTIGDEKRYNPYC